MSAHEDSPPAPPDQVLGSKEEAIEYAQDFAEEHGYALTKDKSAYAGKYTYFGCTRRGRSESKATLRQTSSAKCDCKFMLIIKRIPPPEDNNDDDDEDDDVPEDQRPQPTWQVTTKNGAHNHGPADPLAFSVHRRFDEKIETFVKAAYKGSASASQVFTSIQQQWPKAKATSRDIYNAYARYRAEKLDGLTPTEALLKWLESGSLWRDTDTDREDWVYLPDIDPETRRLRQLFLVYKPAVELWSTNYDILMMDCTYRSNRYNLPLLHFLGDAIKKAAEELWPDVPQLLCIWHVNKNVLTHAQQAWSVKGSDEEKDANMKLRDGFMAAWRDVVYAKTEEAMVEKWNALHLTYADQKTLMQYLIDHQWPQREEVMTCYTSCWRHFGQVATSILEQSHGQLKALLPNSRGDLLVVAEKIKQRADKQLNDYKQRLARDRIAPPHYVKATAHAWLDDNINDEVVPKALAKAVEQYNIYNTTSMSSPECSGAFQAVWGIPCCHTIRDRVRNGGHISVVDFHPHWHFQRQRAVIPRLEVVTPRVREPDTIVTKHRARDITTRRERCAWEVTGYNGRQPRRRPVSTAAIGTQGLAGAERGDRAESLGFDLTQEPTQLPRPPRLDDDWEPIQSYAAPTASKRAATGTTTTTPAPTKKGRTSKKAIQEQWKLVYDSVVNAWASSNRPPTANQLQALKLFKREETVQATMASINGVLITADAGASPQQIAVIRQALEAAL